MSDLAVDSLGGITDSAGMKTLRKTLFAIAVIIFTAQAHAVMYLARPYDPNMGRWMSRDPIGEEGGVNLYGMVLNRPLCIVDVHGMEPLSAGNTFFVNAGPSKVDKGETLPSFTMALILDEAKMKITLESAKAEIKSVWPEKEVNRSTRIHELRHVEDDWQIWKMVHEGVQKLLNLECATKEAFTCFNDGWKFEMNAYLDAMSMLSAMRHSDKNDRVMVYKDADIQKTKADNARVKFKEHFQEALTKYDSCKRKYKICGDYGENAFQAIQGATSEIVRKIETISNTKAFPPQWTFPGAGNFK